MFSFNGGMVLARIFMPSGDTVTGEELAGEIMASWCNGAESYLNLDPLRKVVVYEIIEGGSCIDLGKKKHLLQRFHFCRKYLTVPSQFGIKSTWL